MSTDLSAVDHIPSGDDANRDQISRLEDRIEALAEQLERCRKISLASRISIAAGAALMALMLLGLVPFEGSLLIAAMAAVIGGTVLLGSNSSTWQQTDAAIHQAEKLRTELIGRIDMRVVGSTQL